MEVAGDAVMAWAQHCLKVIGTLGLSDELQNKGFVEFKMRHTGRFDLQVPEFTTNKELSPLQGGSAAPWSGLVKSILGEEAVLLHSGVMLSLPGSHVQPWHQDGPHLDYRKHQPCHSLNVFVPLVDVDRANGGTEMVPTTHILGQSGFDGEPGSQIKPVVVLPKAGEAILFDYRLKHRGLANNGSEPRPVVYLTYASSSNRKALKALTANFSTGRYRALPKLVEKAAEPTRAERLAARKQ